MEYVKLGNSDLNVSRICLGCMGFGEAAAGQHRWTLDEESSNEIIKAILPAARTWCWRRNLSRAPTRRLQTT